jgi:hypothetical protein
MAQEPSAAVRQIESSHPQKLKGREAIVVPADHSRFLSRLQPVCPLPTILSPSISAHRWAEMGQALSLPVDAVIDAPARRAGVVQ